MRFGNSLGEKAVLVVVGRATSATGVITRRTLEVLARRPRSSVAGVAFALALTIVLSVLLAGQSPQHATAARYPLRQAQADAVGASAIRLTAKPPAAKPLAAGLTKVAFTTPAGIRYAHYYVPAGLVGPAPLVVALHGLFNRWTNIRDDSGLDRLADLHHFLVAYPTGLAGSWNAGSCCGFARTHNIDDVSFLDEVISRASTFHPVNPARVHLVGFSGGAMMVYRYACERSDRVSSIAVFGGSLVAPACQPGYPVAVYAIHGALDTTIPFQGCAARQPATGCADPAMSADMPSVPTVLHRWESIDRALCPRQVSTSALTLLATSGHRWPTLANAGFDGGAAVWVYFWSHPRMTRMNGQLPGCV